MSEYSDSSDLINGVVRGLNDANNSVLTNEFQRMARERASQEQAMRYTIKEQKAMEAALLHSNKIMEASQRRQASRADTAERENNELKALNSALEQKNKEYQELLAKPLSEIIDDYKRLKDDYDKLHQKMEDWIYSQKAFRTLAYEYAALLNMTDEQVEKNYAEIIKSVKYLDWAARAKQKST